MATTITEGATAVMTDRGDSNRIGGVGEKTVALIIEKERTWIARPQHVDVGVDLEAEIDDGGAFGQFLKIQVKATDEAPPARVPGATESIFVTKTFLRYAQECRLPIIVVRVWLRDDSASYVWIQEWMESNRDRLGLDQAEPKTVQLPVPLDADLREGLRGRLKDIARGATPLQFRLTLRELARWAVVHRSAASVEKLGELLVALGTERDAPVGALIDEMVTFSTVGLEPGQVRGMWEYHELLPIVTHVCRAFAKQFTREQVVRLIARPESFSRAAMYGLSLLYDVAPDHIASLDLPAAFDELGLEFLAFYCRLRERYLGIPSMKLAFSDLPLTAPGGTVERDDGFLNRWANRGDSAFYDCWDPD